MAKLQFTRLTPNAALARLASPTPRRQRTKLGATPGLRQPCFQNFPLHPVTNKERKREREKENEECALARKIYIISQSARLRHLAAGYRIKSSSQGIPFLQDTRQSSAETIEPTRLNLYVLIARYH
jgi:hypothetical protein